jgi:hypothetical protein
LQSCSRVASPPADRLRSASRRPAQEKEVATAFVTALLRGDSAAARKLVAHDQLEASDIRQMARLAKANRLRLVRTADLGSGHYKYWFRGRHRQRASRILVVVGGYFEVIMSRPKSAWRVDDWRYYTSNLKFKFP